MLIAGAGTNSTSTYGGTLTFDVCNPLSWMGWIFGSAYNLDMLVAGASAYCTFTGGAFAFNVSLLLSDEWWAVGSAFLLLAGACADNASSFGGGFSFVVGNSPSRDWWGFGSAYIYR